MLNVEATVLVDVGCKSSHQQDPNSAAFEKRTGKNIELQRKSDRGYAARGEVRYIICVIDYSPVEVFQDEFAIDR